MKRYNLLNNKEIYEIKRFNKAYDKSLITNYCESINEISVSRILPTSLILCVPDSNTWPLGTSIAKYDTKYYNT